MGNYDDVLNPPRRRVPAGGVLIGYCQLAMIGAMAEGMPRDQASSAGWELFRTLVKAATGQQLPPPGVNHSVSTPTNCLAESSYGIHEALRMTWAEFRAEHPDAEVSVVLPEDTIVKLAMLLDCVYRVSNGVELFTAARQADDYATGRPRQRRRPVDSEWLTGRIDDVQDAVWRALVGQQSFDGLPAEPPGIERG